jgi:hypothetical protein
MFNLAGHVKGLVVSVISIRIRRNENIRHVLYVVRNCPVTSAGRAKK